MSSFCQLQKCWENQAFVAPNLMASPSWKPKPSGIGSSFSYIYDHVHSVYRHVDSSFYQLTGHDAQEILHKGLKFMDEIVHDDDQEPVMNLLIKAWQIVLSQPAPYRMEYNMSVDYRVRHANGRWVHLIQHNHILSTDAIGNIVYSAGICYDISHWQKKSPPTLSLYHKNQLIDRWKANPINIFNMISSREKEVVREVCKGKTSLEIADTLCISKHTVDTHRKAIMRKLGIKGTPALVKYAHQHQLLES